MGRKIREQRDLRRKLVFRKSGITSGELLVICTPPGDELHTGRRAELRGMRNSHLTGPLRLSLYLSVSVFSPIK